MWIYIGLIVAILFASLFFRSVYSYDYSKSENAILIFGMILIFLLLTLKKDTVGIDISGYERIYNSSANYAVGDYDWVYFEKGYTLISQWFALNGFSFQFFAGVLYVILCLSLFFFIKKYSADATLSLLIFICYQFFVFSISGLRQTLATALCLLIYMCLEKKTVWRIIISVALMILSINIHQSSMVFIVVILLSLMKKESVRLMNWIIIFLLALVSRTYIWGIVNQYIKEVDVTTAVSIGGSFVLLLGLAVFEWATTNLGISAGAQIINDNGIRYLYDDEIEKNEEEKAEAYDNAFFQRMMFMSVVMTVLFSGSSMQRAAMYCTVFMIPSVPRFISMYDGKTKLVLTALFGAFLILLFYIQTLVPNQLSLCPYLFFWQAG